jgi:Asp-tRNA(Asn)/Glu-tRNA(Gln) amidotransferase A subunit family amidase
MMAALVPGFETPGPAPLDELRIGVAWLEEAAPVVARTVGEAAQKLPGAVPVTLPFPGGAFPAFQREIAEVHRDLIDRYADLYGTNVRTKIERALEVSDAEDANARAARERYRDEFAEAMAGVDLVIAPTLPVPPPPADVDEFEVRSTMTEFTFPFNMVGAPVLALPCGTADGLPCGLQLGGRPGDDALVLAAGAALERALAAA